MHLSFLHSSLLTLSYLPLTIFAQFPTLSLPPLTGPHKIGTTTLYLPNPPRDIMISLFYPTSPNINSQTYPLAPVFDPGYATFLETTVGLPPGLASSLISQAHAGAPLYTPKHPRKNGCEHSPILLFSPGYGGSRLDYTATLSNLASEGFIVIGVDHPFDTTFISYPDRTAFHLPLELNETSAAEVVDLRVTDLRFVLNYLARKERVIPGLKGKLDVDDVGVLGHSIGGAASASTILADRRFDCGANLDGSFWGPVVTKGIQGKSFLIIASENRNSSSDASWASFWKNSNKRGEKGFELEIAVKGAEHGSFSDQALLYEYLKELGLVPEVPAEVYGTIGGRRILIVESAYLSAFFDYCFTGKKEKLLKGPNSLFPEVVFWPK